MPAAGDPGKVPLEPSHVVHHIELTSSGPGSAWTGTLTSTVQRRAAASKETCNVCQQVVRVRGSGDGSGAGEVDQDGAEDEGLKCRSCCWARHFKCDALSRLEFSSLKTVSRRYICSSCLDLAIRRETSHVSSIGSTCLADASMPGLGVPASKAQDDGTKGLKETEVIPSKEEMKQMIREVVDDVIRSTISQVINQKVLVTCNACSSDSSGSGCECKVLPSVTSLDKQAEEETKTTKSEDLLLLLKSPDVEVKHFLPSSKPANSLDQIVTSQDIELKKRQILELVSLKSGERSSSLCPESHGGNQGGEYGDDGTNCGTRTSSEQQHSTLWSQCGDEEQHDHAAVRDDLQDEIEEIGEDATEERVLDADDDYDADEDGGEYESIRFDREDLESKACLGFAHLDPHVDHKSVSGAADVAHVPSNDHEDHSDIRSAMPIKLNQLDLSKFIA